MSIYIQKDQKVQLDKLADISGQELENFLDVIRSREFTATIEDSEHSEVIKALLKLLVDAKRLQLSDKEFESQLRHLTSIGDEKIAKLVEFFDTSDELIRELVDSDEHFFRDLEWRVETKIASRFCNSLPVDPKILLKFHVDNEASHSHRENLSEKSTENSRREITVQTSLNNLSHIIGKLEAAKMNVSSKRPTT